MAAKFPSGNERGDNSDDEFEDALSEMPALVENGELDEDTAKAYLIKVVDLMLVNKYKDAESVVRPWLDSNMFCAVAGGSILFCRAMMTFDRDVIQEALASLNKAIELCNTHRRKQGVLLSVMSVFQGKKLTDYTPNEHIAEVFHAGCNLLSAILIFIQDENIMNFVKSGIKLQGCHSQYKACYSWLLEVEQNGMIVDENVSSGIRMGIGTFNLVLSLLPPRILKVLEFVGFSGDRELGIAELRKASKGRTLYSALSSVTLLFDHCVTSSLLGFEESGVGDAEELLAEMDRRYPKSHVFTYFIGRFEMIKGHMSKALGIFSTGIDSRIEWTQVQHLYYWEMMWCHSAKCEWKEAVFFAKLLSEQSRWSKTIFLFIWASLMIMWRREHENGRILKNELQEPNESVQEIVPSWEDIGAVMTRVPLHVKKIAGKTMPLERHGAARAEQFLKDYRIPLPIFELFYGWNLFQMTSKNEELSLKHLELVQMELSTIRQSSNNTDDFCLVKHLEGVCYKALKQWEKSESCFLEVMERGDGIVHSEYLLPAASMEIGLVHIEQGKLESASKWLHLAKNNYKGYNLEYRINFRIHAGLMKIQNKLITS